MNRKELKELIGSAKDARLIPENERLDFFPSYFNVGAFIAFEGLLYSTMQEKSGGDYTGGSWDFIEVTSDREEKSPLMVYIREKEITLTNEDNFFQGTLSSFGASICIFLYCLNRMSWYLAGQKNMKESEKFDDAYFALREWIFSDENTCLSKSDRVEIAGFHA